MYIYFYISELYIYNKAKHCFCYNSITLKMVQITEGLNYYNNLRGKLTIHSIFKEQLPNGSTSEKNRTCMPTKRLITTHYS